MIHLSVRLNQCAARVSWCTEEVGRGTLLRNEAPRRGLLAGLARKGGKGGEAELGGPWPISLWSRLGSPRFGSPDSRAMPAKKLKRVEAKNEVSSNRH